MIVDASARKANDFNFFATLTKKVVYKSSVIFFYVTPFTFSLNEPRERN